MRELTKEDFKQLRETDMEKCYIELLIEQGLKKFTQTVEIIIPEDMMSMKVATFEKKLADNTYKLTGQQMYFKVLAIHRKD